MSQNVITVLIAWGSGVVLFLGVIVLLRYLRHRERMALITHGIHPDTPGLNRRSNGMLRAGLITMMVGLSLTVGLYPIGFLIPDEVPAAPLRMGPWLLPGLIPLGIGLALTISYYLEQNNQSIPEKTEKAEEISNVILFEDRLEKDQRDQG